MKMESVKTKPCLCFKKLESDPTKRQ